MIDYAAELEHLAKATPGDTRNVSALYAAAAMWLRAGESLHPKHAAWLADRLDHLSCVIEAQELAKLPTATWASSGKRGRKALDEADMGKRKIAVMLYAELQGSLEHDALLARVAGDCLLTPDNVRDAWKSREELFPDLFPVTGQNV